MPEPGYQSLTGVSYTTDLYSTDGFGDGFGARINAPFNILDSLGGLSWSSVTGQPIGSYAFQDDFGYGLSQPDYPPYPTQRPPTIGQASTNGGQGLAGTMSGGSNMALILIGIAVAVVAVGATR